MATKNLVPRADEEGKLGLSDRRWLEVNAVSGSFGNFKSNELKNLAGNQLLKAGAGITIEGPSAADEGEGAQYTISAADTGSSNAEVDRIFAGPTNAEDVTTQQQAVIANYDADDSTNNKLIFKTNEADRWYIDNNGHYVPASDVTYDLGNSVDAVRNLYVGSAKQSGQGIRLVSQSGNQLSLSVKDSRFAVSSSPSLTIDGNTEYDSLLLVKSPVRVATTENLDAAYDNATFTLTANNLGVLSIDGVNVFNVEDRVLVKDQTDKSENGIYIVTVAGDDATAFVLTRADDLSGAIDFSGLSVSVIEGTDNAGKIFFSSSTTIGSILGTSPLVWNDFNSTGLTAIIEDSDPHLGAHLDLNNFNLFDNQSIQLLPNSVAEGKGIELSKNNLKVNFTSATDPEFTIPTLSLASSADKEINIASVASASFFTGTLSASNSFTYTFDSTLLTDTEKTAGQAIFATKGWVDSQSFLTNTDLPEPQDLSGYVVRNAAESLKTLEILGSPDSVVGILMGSKNIRNLAAPTEDTDAATKQYVDNTIQSVASVLDTCIVATTENLVAVYDNANFTLTADQNGELPSIDGYPTASLVEADPASNVLGSRILVKNQTNKVHNGVYELISKGDAGNPWIFERTTDFASGFQASGSFIYVEYGDTNKGNGFICTSDSNNDTVNTDVITFVKFSGAGEIQGGDGLTLTGNTLNINVKPAQIEDPENPGQQIANPDRFVYIDNEDNLDVSITNLVAALNDNGGITASAASDFTWPSTALTGDIASADQFVMLDVSANPAAKKNVTAQKIKEHVLLALDGTDITFDYDSGSQTPWTARLKPGIVTNTHLSNTTISSQPFLLNSDPTPEQVKPHADDLILISDVSDSNNLKKVKYSKFLSDLTVTPDFSSATELSESTLALDDKVLVLDSSNSDKVHTLPFSRVARKHDWIGLSGINVKNNITLESDYTYVFSSKNNDTTTYTFTLPSTADELKTIEIIPVTYVNNVDDANLGSAKVNIVLSQDKTCVYSWTDLQETSKLIFVYQAGGWRVKDAKRERLSSPWQLARPVDSNSSYNWGNVIFFEQKFFKYKDYYIFTNSEDQVTLRLPTNDQINSWESLSHNDSIRIYFLASDTIKKVTIDSQGSIYKKLTGTTSNSNTSEFLVNEKVIKFNTSDIPYVDVTWKKIWSNPTNIGTEFSGWVISSPYNVEGQPEPLTLPEGTTGEVLRKTTLGWTAGKVQNLNISTGAVTGGVDANGTATGSIAATSIVGGNIANDTITNDKLKTMNNYKVLGSLDNSSDSEEATHPVNEVNVLEDLIETTSQYTGNNKHTNLVTASAVVTYIDNVLNSTSSNEIINLYTGNTEETFDNGNKPQIIELPANNTQFDILLNLVYNLGTPNNEFNTVNYPMQIQSSGISSQRYVVENLANLDPLATSSNLLRTGYIPNTQVIRPNRYGYSEIRLPSAETWYNLYGSNIHLQVTVTFDVSPAGLAPNASTNGYHNVIFRPNTQDISSISNYQSLNINKNDVIIKDLGGRIPTYIANHSSSGNQNQFQDLKNCRWNSPPSSGIVTFYGGMFLYEEHNAMCLGGFNRSTAKTYKFKLVKLFNAAQLYKPTRFTSWQLRSSDSSKWLDVSECYAWVRTN